MAIFYTKFFFFPSHSFSIDRYDTKTAHSEVGFFRYFVRLIGDLVMERSSYEATD